MRELRGKGSGHFIENGLYHVYNRAPSGQLLFDNTFLYTTFIGIMHEMEPRYDVQVLNFSLMPTHFHLILKVEKPDSICAFMQQLCCTYSRRRNAMLKRRGSAFEKRYEDRPITTEDYLMRALRYVHINPVKDGIVGAPANWPYSDYLKFVSTKATPLQKAVITWLFTTAEAFQAFLVETEDNVRELIGRKTKGRPSSRVILPEYMWTL